MESKKISKEDENRIERFITAYNSIDRFFRKVLHLDNQVSFLNAVKEFGNNNPSWRHKETLLLLSELRNILVHSRTKPYEYLSIPTQSVVQNIELIRDELENPKKVIPEFQREVIKVKPSDPLLSVLELVRRYHFSQFPVYDRDQFYGLITENGIAFWLASHVEKISLVDFEEQTVADVLVHEEERINFDFIGRNTPVYQASSLFSQKQFLEAILITQNGKPTEKPIGIMTRWDIVNLK